MIGAALLLAAVPHLTDDGRIILPDDVLIPDLGDAPLALHDDSDDWWRDHHVIAVTQTETAGYSGGGAMITTLHLLHPTGALALSLPISASKTIRACYSEADYIARNDQCADLYDFDATLTPGADGALIYQTHATQFPPNASLDTDNARLPVAPDADAETVARCTFTRVFYPHTATNSWRPIRPLPDCADFTAI